MISIAKALEKIIWESPFLEDAIYHEYLNLSSFAAYIQPQVENITKKEVSLGSIKMSLSRYQIKQHKNIKFKRFNVEDFFIKKNIHITYMDKNKKNLQIIADLHLDHMNTTHYMAHISWEREIAIIYDEKLAWEIEIKIPENRRKLQLNNLALIGIFLEEDNINDIWIIYTLTKKLNFNNINMVEIISNYTEVSFIVERENLSNSIEALIH